MRNHEGHEGHEVLNQLPLLATLPCVFSRVCCDLIYRLFLFVLFVSFVVKSF